jgi:hypothetical protein
VNLRIVKSTIAISTGLALTAFAGAVPALAYPVGQDTQIVLSKTSAIRAGSTIKVKALNVDRNCEVTFTVAGRGQDAEDYDISSAFAGANYSTAYTALNVPETVGVYEVQADYEPACHVTGTHAKRDRSLFQVGKVVTMSTPNFTALNNVTLVAKKPTLNFAGSLLVKSTLAGSPVGFGGQKVSVVVTVTPAAGAPKSLPPIILTTANDGSYSGKQALKAKDLKGRYTVRATYVTSDAKTYNSETSSASSAISITSVKATVAAAKLAYLAAMLHRAAISKVTR